MDPRSGITGEATWYAIDTSTALKICTDFANRVKHFELTKRPRVDEQTGAIRQDATVSVPPVGDRSMRPTAAHAWIIEANGKAYDALELAREVVAAWRTFLKSRGLATTEAE
jgi:hypothetical protein